ncbi:hypothetical protein SCHPADRAFT_931933 [Schizopora paradoxa]|uniref:Uncharacterized protein n=1 Tax=Schizopora paradoxa TaxID=27342 RepID=A0A0H2RF87_9AGAM|nr:hypothetical protein SCHPADRAFT_931933 [Schizopora paradoxa]
MASSNCIHRKGFVGNPQALISENPITRYFWWLHTSSSLMQNVHPTPSSASSTSHLKSRLQSFRVIFFKIVMSSQDNPNDPNTGTFRHAYSSSHLRRNRTAENLPGPGRTLGLFYDWAGDLVERGIARAARQGNDSTQVTCPTGALSSGLQPYIPSAFTDPRGSDQIPSPSASTFENETESTEELREFVERNATRLNLAGPGRLLGLLYEHAGRALERRAGKAMEKRGHGPHAVAAQIMAIRGPVEYGLVVRQDTTTGDREATMTTPISQLVKPTSSRREGLMYHFPSDAEKNELKKLVKTLLGYTLSGVPATQKTALEYITELAIADSFIRTTIRDCLDNQGVGVTFPQLGGNNDILLHSSRRALISVSDVAVNTIMQNIYDLDARACAYDEDMIDEYIICNDSLMEFFSEVSEDLNKLLQNPNTSFLVLRHLQKLYKMPHSRAVELIQESSIQDTLQHMGSGELSFVEWPTLDYCLNPTLHFPMSAAAVVPLLLRQPGNFQSCSSYLEYFLSYDTDFCCSAYAASTIPKTAQSIRSLVEELSGQSSLTGQLQAVYLLELPNGEKLPVIIDQDTRHYEILTQLIRLVEEGEQDEKDTALFLIQAYKGLTKYTWMDVKQIAAELPSSHSKSLILEDPIWVIHMGNYMSTFWSKFAAEPGPSSEVVLQKMDINIQDILWVQHQSGKPLEQGAHHYIQAGFGPEGVPLYLASHSRALISKWFSTVAIGDTFITPPDFGEGSHYENSSTFSTLVFRYDPDVLSSV